NRDIGDRAKRVSQDGMYESIQCRHIGRRAKFGVGGMPHDFRQESEISDYALYSNCGHRKNREQGRHQRESLHEFPFAQQEQNQRKRKDELKFEKSQPQPEPGAKITSLLESDKSC